MDVLFECCVGRRDKPKHKRTWPAHNINYVPFFCFYAYETHNIQHNCTTITVSLLQSNGIRHEQNKQKIIYNPFLFNSVH